MTEAAGLDAALTVHHSARFTLDAVLRVAPGETVVVMGPSGAGKSTLLGALAGIVPLTTGHVRLGDRELSTPRRRVEPVARDTVLLGQDPRLFPHLSARDNVAFGLRARGVPRDDAARRAEHLLARVGLPDAAPHRPADLSGGQQQRVALARAVAASPRLVLLDEPLTSLDPGTAGEIRVLLAELLHAVTCVVVTHDAVDAVALADRLLVLESGRVSQAGRVREVFAAPATPFVAGLAGLNHVPGTVRDGVWSAGPLRVAAGGMPDSAAITVFAPSAVRADDAASVAGSSAVQADASDDAGPSGNARRLPEREAVRWAARVVRVEQTLGGVRVFTAEPAIAFDVPFDAWAQHPVVAGDAVALTLDPARVRLLPR